MASLSLLTSASSNDAQQNTPRAVFDEQFVFEIANRVADIVLARTSKPTVERRYLSVEEAAIYTGYTVGALWKHIQRGHLAVSREGQSTRVDKLEIDKWMLRNRQ